MSVEFPLMSLVIIVMPGTGVLYTLAAGLSRGLRAGIAAAFVAFGTKLALAGRGPTPSPPGPLVARATAALDDEAEQDDDA